MTDQPPGQHRGVAIPRLLGAGEFGGNLARWTYDRGGQQRPPIRSAKARGRVRGDWARGHFACGMLGRVAWLRRLGDPAQQVMAVALSPDGRQVASAGAGASGHGTVCLWEVATGALVWSADDLTARALAIAFAPDGSSLASASADGTLVLRDLHSGSALRTLAGHQCGATSVAFSADGTIVCAGGADERAYLWQTRTGRLVRTIGTTASVGQLVVGRQQALVTSVALSADGGTLVTCSGGRDFGDRQVRVWDTQTNTLRREFSRPQMPAGSSPLP